MRAVRANRKLELEQELVRDRTVAVYRMAILAPHLTELARPIRQNERLTGVEQGGVVRSVGSIVARPGKPSARELVIARDVVPHRFLLTSELVAAAPNHFGPTDEGMIDGPLHRPPSKRGVDSVQLRRKASDVHAVDQP